MRIAHIIGYFQPEFGYKEYYLAKCQAALGHEVHVITSDRISPFPNFAVLAKSIGISPDRRRSRGSSIVDGVHVHRLPAVFDIHGVTLLYGFQKALYQYQPDLVHAYEPLQLAPVLAAFYKKRFQYTLFADFQQFSNPETLLGKLYFFSVGRFLGQKLFQEADRVLLCTDQTREFVLRNYHIDDKKITMIPLGFDPELFSYEPKNGDLTRRRLNIPHDAFVIISAGKIERRKRYELVLRAMAGVEKSLKRDILFLLLGSGDDDYLRELTKVADTLQLSNNFRVHHFVPRNELRWYYNAADVGIWPDLPSITIVEAIGCGLPVILPNLQTVTHLTSDGNGELFEPNSPPSLASALKKCVLETKYYSQLRRNTIEKASTRYNYMTIANNIVSLAADIRKARSG